MKLPLKFYFRRGWGLAWGLFFLLAKQGVQAQGTPWNSPYVAVGQWRSHLSFGRVTCLEKVDKKVYAGCGAGLFVYDLEDESLERITRVNGLNDVEVAALSYSSSHQTLVIAYANGNLDLYKNGQVEALDAVLKANIPLGKRIRSIHQAGRFVYLCYGFGIVELDLLKTEIRSTFVIGPQGSYLGVNSLVQMDGQWWAATDSGLYTAPIDAPNLQSFEFWTQDPYWGKKTFPSLVIYRDSLVSFQGDSLLWYKNGGHRTMVVNAGSPNVFLGVSGGQLQVVNTLRAVRLNEQLQFNNYPIANESVRPTCALYDAYQVWMGDDGGGLFRFTPWDYFRYLPEGPTTNKVFQLKANAAGVAVAGGAYQVGSGFGNTFDPSGASLLQVNRWKALNRETVQGVGNLYDVIGALPDPNRIGRVWLSTWGRGVAMVEGDSAVMFDATNSSLQAQQGTTATVRVSGMDMDSRGDLWMSNFGAARPVVVRRANGLWESFGAGPHTELLDMLVDRLGNKWMRNRNGGLVVLDASNARYVTVTNAEGNGGLPSNQVISMAQDRDGSVWIGTSEGPVVFYNPSAVFRTSFNATRIKIRQEQFVGYLLGTELIQSIVTDGANRKWFGTANGLWLFNPECTELIQHFTMANAPLPSNSILALAIEPSSGEVLVGTDKGLMGFRSTSTQGVDQQGHVQVFPNPVEPSFEGLLSVRGLVADAWIKITDASGALVYQTKADGGQVTWNLQDPTGRRVRSGVYLIHAVGFDSFDLTAQTVVAKAVVITGQD